MGYNYKIVDAHCDTIAELYKKAPLLKNDAQLDIERMKKYDNYLQIFALWADAKNGTTMHKKRCNELIDRFYREIEINKEHIVHIKIFSDIEKAWQNGKVAALLGIEGADCIDSIEELERFFDAGVRAITLTWNGTNAIASGVGDERADFGLTDFGKKAVRKMNELGILIDVSHISYKAFWAVLEVTNAPVSATHSNAKAICNHKRNLTDEQFLAICKNGGVVGINYYTEFLTDKGRASIDDVVRHIEHFFSLGGENHIGLGSDFDGIDSSPDDLCGVEDVYKILDRLLMLNYTEESVKKIAYKNFCTLFKAVIK